MVSRSEGIEDVVVRRAAANVHPLACVSADARLGANVSIGAFAVVEAGAQLADGVVVSEHAIVRAEVSIGAGTFVDSHAVIGGRAQMRGVVPPAGRVAIGARCIVREGVTVHRPATEAGATLVGDDCMLMANCHVGHDTRVGDGVTLGNNVMLAGHVVVGDGVFVGGGAGVHQFVRIGAGAMIGGNASISYDVAPYVIAAERNAICGLNLVGLRRRNVSGPSMADLKRCYHAVFGGSGCLQQRAAAALTRALCGVHAEGGEFLAFFATGRRGFARCRGK